jgi:AraC-like DNA-binding protein
MNLLQQPGARVRDAARALGFSGDVSFVHFVKREFGKTPGALRDELSPERSPVPPGASENGRAPHRGDEERDLLT